MMLASLAAVVALAAPQPAQDDAPVRTAAPERVSEAEPPPTAAKPVDEVKTAPPAVAAAKSLAFQEKTLVDGGNLQVVLGQRASFRLDSKGLPVLAKVEEGKLAAAHPDGEVTETFAPPPDGQI